MGAENTGSSGKTFWNVFDGKFAVRVQADTPNAVTRENKMKKVVHELHYDTLSNMMITGIKKVDSQDYGPSWQIELQEADEKHSLNLSYSGGVTNGFMFRLPNIDLKRPVTLRTGKFNDKESGKEKLYLVLEQDGKKIEPFFSKATPRGLPQPKETVVNNKPTWDYTDQMVFIENMLNESIIPKLAVPAQNISAHTTGENPGLEGMPEDDLPF